MTRSILTATSTGHALLQVLGIKPGSWPGRALCADHNPDAWFPPGGGGRAPERRMAMASASVKAVCGDCPVREACLMEALERNERHGVWGGLDEFERKALRRRRPRAESGVR